MRVSAIIPAAGVGRRMHSKREKPFIRLHGRWLLAYVLEMMQKVPAISEIIVATGYRNIDKVMRLAARDKIDKLKAVVKGGKSRCESVYNALCNVSYGCDYVLIHDVARPLVSQKLIRDTIRTANRYKAAISAVPVKPTIKKVRVGTMLIEMTLDRRSLWEAQTPQVFRKDLLLDSYRSLGSKAWGATDEASLLEAAGRRVRIVQGEYQNIKITTSEDLRIAEAIIRTR